MIALGNKQYKGKLILIAFAIVTLLNSCDCETDYEKCLRQLTVWDTKLYPQHKDMLIGSSKGNNTIRIFYSAASDPKLRFAWLYNLAYEYQASALTMSYQQFCKQGGLVDKDLNIEVIFLNDKCSMDAIVPNMVLMDKAKGDVILGLPCSTVTVLAGHYAKHYNIPIISSASNDDALSDKMTYSTLLRLGNGYRQLGSVFIEIFKEFNWKRLSILTNKSGRCIYGSSNIRKTLANSKYTTIVEYNEVDFENTDEDLRQFLENFKDRARVMLVCLTTPEIIRLFEIAYDMGMTTPDFVYIQFAITVSSYILEPWGNLDGLDEETTNKRMSAFSRLITVVAETQSAAKDALKQEMSDQMSKFPWFNNVTKNLGGITASVSGLYMYDIMTFYLSLVNETLAEGIDPRNGTLILDRARNRIFEGVSGEVILNNKADRISVFWIWQKPSGARTQNVFAKVRVISPEGQRVTVFKQPVWGTEDGMPPPDEPVCGYRNDECSNTKGRLFAILGGLIGVAIIAIITFTLLVIYRKRKFEDDLQRMTWKIFYEDIDFSSNSIAGSKLLSSSVRSVKSTATGHISVMSNANFYLHGSTIKTTQFGRFKRSLVITSKTEKTDCKLCRQDLVDLKLVKDMHHENINSFIGASIKSPHIYVLHAYCSRGTLTDILAQDDIQLDWAFKFSLIFDLANGLQYIHHCPLSSHGHLKSTDCLIDSRWVLKISNYGLNNIKYANVSRQDADEYTMYLDELWTAPELLRMDPGERPIRRPQSADIYSLAIILQEIVFREKPYFMKTSSPKDIIQKVKGHSDTPYRPIVSYVAKDINTNMLTLMKVSWNEDPDLRPNMDTIVKNLVVQNGGKKINIMDTMVQNLERYAGNLEDIVEKRMDELLQEKRKTDLLLYRMLPSIVAERLKNGLEVTAEIFESVSIYFSDIVGFTAISSESSPIEVVNLLNDLYTFFDDIIAKHDVYKVETIGDAYMVVSGCPNRNGKRHAAEIANMSLSLRENVKRFQIRHIPNRPLRIRIGVHSGSVAAGVVGLTMPRYCLFGDTVNVASRMESNGEAMKIHISNTTYDILEEINQYEITCRGQVHLKGKGAVTSFWLDGRKQ